MEKNFNEKNTTKDRNNINPNIIKNGTISYKKQIAHNETKQNFLDSKKPIYTKNFRNVGLQTITQPKEYVPPSVAIQHNLETEEYPKIFTIPHNVTALVVTCLIIFILSFKKNNFLSEYFDDNYKMGIFGCVICICVFGSLFFPDSLLRRPHPIFWRLIMSITILYLLFITFMLFQTRDDARNLLKFFDKNLGKPLPEKNYAENCEVFSNKFPYVDLTNIFNAFDHFLTAHLIGWYVKMLIVRNSKLCWFLSILFEILEITFRHWLPNFWECWWDHTIFDVLGCNALGIWLGDLTCKYFEIKTYGWMKITPAAVIKDNGKEHNYYCINNNFKNNNKYQKESISSFNSESKLKSRFQKSLNIFKYFTPNYFVKHDWKVFSSFKRFYSFLWFIIFMNMVDLSNFFGKFVLWIPATHFILLVRVHIWAFLAIITTREYYEYISNKSYKRLGPFIWISHLTLLVEWTMIYKFSDGFFQESFPHYVIYFWLIVGITITAITVNLIIKDFIQFFKKEEVGVKKINLTDPLIDIEELERKENIEDIIENRQEYQVKDD